MALRLCSLRGRTGGATRYAAILQQVRPHLLTTFQSILGWQCAIRADGVAYSVLGLDGTLHKTVSNVTTKSIQITPTRSIYYMQAGPMNVTLTFLSPVEVMPRAVTLSHEASIDGLGVVHSLQTGSDSLYLFHTSR